MTSEDDQGKKSDSHSLKSKVLLFVGVVMVFVVLAVALGAYVLGTGDTLPGADAEVDVDVNKSADSLTVTVTSMNKTSMSRDNADYVFIRGQQLQTKLDLEGQPDGYPFLSSTGDSLILRAGPEAGLGNESGTLAVIALRGDLENTSVIWSKGYERKLNMQGVRDEDIPEGAIQTTIRIIEYDFNESSESWILPW